jgi:glycine cleavage system aminomethyltransferase T
MATVPPALASEDARITISDAGRLSQATVTTRPFYDPDGAILRS